MDIRKEVQQNKIADEYSALIAVVKPIILGTLYAVKRERLESFNLKYHEVTLRQLASLYSPGDGDCGISFEYAVHDAILNNNPFILEKIDTALTKYCKIKGENPSSILFGAEKNGAVQLIRSVKDHLTDESKLLSGSKGQPVRLKKHIDSVAAAFRKKEERDKLPDSINGLWKADLFVGKPKPDQWVGTSVKINPRDLEYARGLRLGIVPCNEGKSDKIFIHETKNIIVCPLPYDGSFMEIFYQAWGIVKQFLQNDANLPKEAYITRAVERQVCRLLVDRKSFTILEALDGLAPLAQPYLLTTVTENVNIHYRKGKDSNINTVIAPYSKNC